MKTFQDFFLPLFNLGQKQIISMLSLSDLLEPICQSLNFSYIIISFVKYYCFLDHNMCFSKKF